MYINIYSCNSSCMHLYSVQLLDLFLNLNKINWIYDYFEQTKEQKQGEVQCNEAGLRV